MGLLSKYLKKKSPDLELDLFSHVGRKDWRGRSCREAGVGHFIEAVLSIGKLSIDSYHF
jgi:hypothetical protein